MHYFSFLGLCSFSFSLQYPYQPTSLYSSLIPFMVKHVSSYLTEYMEELDNIYISQILNWNSTESIFTERKDKNVLRLILFSLTAVLPWIIIIIIIFCSFARGYVGLLFPFALFLVSERSFKEYIIHLSKILWDRK